MATYSSLASRIPRTEEPNGLQSTGLQTVGQDRASHTPHTHTHTQLDKTEQVTHTHSWTRPSKSHTHTHTHTHTLPPDPSV